MRIVIDLQGCQSLSRYRGIGRYSLSLAQAMARQAGGHEVWLALNGLFPDTIDGLRHSFTDLIPQERMVTFAVPGPVAGFDSANAWRSHAAELIREAFLADLKPDIVHVSSLFEGLGDDAVVSIGRFRANYNSAATMYDLIPLRDPEALPSGDQARKWYDDKLKSLMRTDLLMAISEYSRREAVEMLDLPESQIVNISSAVEPSFRRINISADQEQTLRTRYGLPRPFVMCAGGCERRKNIEGLIEAYARLPKAVRDNYQLVIVWKLHPEERRKLLAITERNMLTKEEVVFTGYVSDVDLIALYNLCALYVFPSHYEGFGLPALEAMACGAPVIGSNSTSIPEVIGWPDALFDPARVEDIAVRMNYALTNRSFRECLRENGVKRSTMFSWDATAKRAISALESLHEKRVNSHRSSVGCGRSEEFSASSYTDLIRAVAAASSTVSPREADWISTASSIAFNRVEAERQLLVDVSILVQWDPKTGIQRVVRSILSFLLTNPPEGYRVLPIYDDGGNYRYASRFTTQFLGREATEATDCLIEVNRGDIFFGLDLVVHPVSNNKEFFLRLHAYGVKVFFLVYDLLPVLRPAWFPSGLEEPFSSWLYTIAQCSDGLVCISRTVAEELIEWLHQYGPERDLPLMVGFSHIGAEIGESIPSTGMPPDSALILERLAERPTFIMVGTVEPRKGHRQTIAAFDLLWSQGADVNLVIVGKQGWKMDDFAEQLHENPQQGERLFWLVGISDEFLEQIYKKASALVFASEGEGFGLPLIEAAQHHIPIIVRDLPVFREVAGEHASYFSGLEPEALADAISEWLVQYHAGCVPQSKGMPRLTWQQSTQCLLNVLLEGHWYTSWLSEDIDQDYRRDLAEKPLVIDFAKPRQERIIATFEGLSGVEPWGRWSDANESHTVNIRLKAPLPAMGTFAITARGFGPNAVRPTTIRLGAIEHKVTFGPNDTTCVIEHQSFTSITMIEFVPPQPVSPKELGVGNDERRLGIGLIRMSFMGR